MPVQFSAVCVEVGSRTETSLFFSREKDEANRCPRLNVHRSQNPRRFEDRGDTGSIVVCSLRPVPRVKVCAYKHDVLASAWDFSNDVALARWHRWKIVMHINLKPDYFFFHEAAQELCVFLGDGQHR